MKLTNDDLLRLHVVEFAHLEPCEFEAYDFSFEQPNKTFPLPFSERITTACQ